MDWKWSLMVAWTILCALPIGAFSFSTGVILPYLYSYIIYQGNWVAMHNLHIIATIILMCGCGLGWMFGVAEKWFGPRPVFTILSITLVSALLAPFWFTDNFPAILAVSVVYGMVTGNILAFITTHVSRHGGAHSGRLIGLLGFCFAFSGTYGNLICSFFINPHNVPQVEQQINNQTISVFTDPDIIARTPYIWVGFSALGLVILVPGVFLLFQKIPQLEDHPDHFDQLDQLNPEPLDQPAEHDKSIRDTLKLLLNSSTFYALFLSMMAIAVGQLICGDFVKVFGSKEIKDDKFFNDAGIAIHATNALSRVFWGDLSDRMNMKYILVFNNLLASLLIPTLYFARANKIVYIVVSCVIASSLGTTSVLPGALVTCHGKKNNTLKYGILLTGEVFGSLFYSLVMVIISRHLSDLYISVLLAVPACLAFLGATIILKI